ncbi:hypothetical protein NDU88_006409 [Pleurodeles waltl]|uniref:Uncharacterized protein n=1 Tax=Pleurodeles waltl TaxID=8319 RepID=A0AAV7X1K6_PLEWA|nr:hypothetical protein NDU88_006409 [Pleurodeles waltl]
MDVKILTSKFSWAIGKLEVQSETSSSDLSNRVVVDSVDAIDHDEKKGILLLLGPGGAQPLWSFYEAAPGVNLLRSAAVLGLLCVDVGGARSVTYNDDGLLLPFYRRCVELCIVPGSQNTDVKNIFPVTKT